jgi:hypothetical protein
VNHITHCSDNICNLKNEKGAQQCTVRGKGPVANSAFKARTSFIVPKDYEASCFYLLEIEILGGD